MISYEWTLETIEDGDISDSTFESSLTFNKEDLAGNSLGLVRYEGTESKGITDMVWAYVKNGKLPECFINSMGESINIKVPQKYHIELQKYLTNHI